MAKTAPVKSLKKSTSQHSRAARRATSPSIDTDKSLKNVTLPTESSTYRPAVLSANNDSRVAKSPNHGRKGNLSSKARKRQEKAMDRAEAVMDKKQTNIEKSKGRARNVQERAKDWDQLNRRILAQKMAEDAARDAKDGWENEEDEDAEQVPSQSPSGGMNEVEMDGAAAEAHNVPSDGQAMEHDEGEVL